MEKISKISVVVPVYNEVGNISLLADQIGAVMAPLPYEWELWLIDDGSTDGSLDAIRSICRVMPQAGFISFARNRGQSAAFGAGFAAATGDAVITMDADLQNDPADIPAMIELYEQGFDMVIGWRYDRQDASSRKFASKIGNAFRNFLTHETVHDTGCSLKIMRASMARQLPMFKGMHRFLTTLMKMNGAKVAEIKVNHRARHSGESKYGTFSRGLAASQDLLAVNWMLRRNFRPEIREKQCPSGTAQGSGQKTEGID
ncbi:MAG: glycosyltransferase family 2 protein [Mailhella sp.]|nr:glycosyltransferase family 2 protein [Mailhella sp.]